MTKDVMRLNAEYAKKKAVEAWEKYIDARKCWIDAGELQEKLLTQWTAAEDNAKEKYRELEAVEKGGEK